jgi:hypothetical protein
MSRFLRLKCDSAVNAAGKMLKAIELRERDGV